jgi:hypothetical protein
MERRQFLTGAGAAMGTSMVAGGSQNDPPGVSALGLRAKWLRTVADDFIVDVWRNGEKIADAKRALEHEIFGATVEKIDVEVRSGDWLVFHVVHNRLRWGGAKYFGVAGFVADGEITVVSEADSGRWSACDDPREAEKFVTLRDHLAHRKPKVIELRWEQGDVWMNQIAGDKWQGKPIWGAAASAWLKYRA